MGNFGSFGNIGDNSGNAGFSNAPSSFMGQDSAQAAQAEARAQAEQMAADSNGSKPTLGYSGYGGYGGEDGGYSEGDRNADRESQEGHDGGSGGAARGGLMSLAAGGRGTSLRGVMGALHGTERLMTYADGGGVSGGGTMHLDVPINVGGGGMGGGMGGGGYTPMGGGFGNGNNMQQGGTPAMPNNTNGSFGSDQTTMQSQLMRPNFPQGQAASPAGVQNGQQMTNMQAYQQYLQQFQQQASPAGQTNNSNMPSNPAFTRQGLGMAEGGVTPGQYNLGSYSDGGRLLRGPGDGVSDSIPATIGHNQPARLADGEFVFPARIVSEIGNGSTEAGARKLYQMMARIQAARGKTIGKNKVATDTKAEKYLSH